MVIDWLLRNLALWFGLIIMLSGVLMFKTSKRDRGMAAVIIVLGVIVLYLFLTSPAHAPITVGTPAAGTPLATPGR
jgi:cytochrome c biogenesis factor